MSFDLSALKVLLRKIFPPEECVYTVDTMGDGNSDSILIRAVNVVFPIEVPQEIIIEDFSDKNIDPDNFDPSEYFQFYLDEEPITISKENVNKKVIQDKFRLFHGKEEFSFFEIMQGALSGRLIAMGDYIDILIKVSKETLAKLSIGHHVIKIESSVIPSLQFDFIISEKNLDLSYNIDEGNLT